MKYRPELTQELIKQFVHYNPDTGVLVRTHALNRAHQIVPKHHIPTATNIQGYLQLRMFKTPRLVHRLAWLYMRGSVPKEIDHINGDRRDNRWVNLREVTSSENKRNMGVSVTNKSGVPGVFFYPRYQKWEVTITRENQHHYLGRFESFDEVVEVRRSAEVALEFHPNHGARPSWRE